MSRANPITIYRSLARFPHVDISEVAVRETFGHDETQAKGLAAAKGSGASATDVTVQLSVVSFDGKPVDKQPFSAFDEWNSRTRAFVFAAWKKINGVTEVESKQLVGAGKPIAGGKGFAFALDDFSGVDVKSFAIRETTSVDERLASVLAERNGTNAIAEMVRLSIVSVDGKQLAEDDERAFYDEWNSRTRAFAFAAWRSLNSVVDDEINDFLAGETQSPAGSPAK